MCGKAEESLNDVLSECSKLSQKEYKRRHDWFVRKIRWEICRKYGIEVEEKWCEHRPEVIMENVNVRHYGISQYKLIMKYMGEDQMSLWYRRIKIIAR